MTVDACAAPGGLWVDRPGLRAGVGDRELPLSPREVELLLVLAAGSDRVVSRRELARRTGLTHAPRRCDVLLVGVRRVLGADAVVNVRGRGWMLTVAPTVLD